MECISNMSNEGVLCSIGKSSSNTVLGTLQLNKIKGRGTPKQGIIVVKSTTNQSICSHKSSITCKTASEAFRSPDLSKRILTGVLNIPR